MGNSPRDCGQWLGFIFIWWGIVLMGSCPRTLLKRENIPQNICHNQCRLALFAFQHNDILPSHSFHFLTRIVQPGSTVQKALATCGSHVH